MSSYIYILSISNIGQAEPCCDKDVSAQLTSTHHKPGIKPQKWPGAWHPNLCTKPYPMAPFVAPRNDSDSCRSATDRHNSDTVIQLVARIRKIAPFVSMWTGVVHILFDWTNLCIHTCKISILFTIRCHIEEFLVHPGRCAVGCLRVWDILRPGGGAAWYPHWHGFLVLQVQWLQIKRGVFVGVLLLRTSPWACVESGSGLSGTSGT